jgi:arylsulfatase A-like enzyme
MRRLRICLAFVVVGLSLQPLGGGTAAAQAPDRPNIVLILTDDQTLDSMPQMPFLSSHPGGHWTEFSNAFLNTPLCCPSRATILSGQYSHHTGVRTNEDGTKLNESSTIATWLQGVGYRTGLFGKYLNHYPFGLPPYIPRGWSDWFAINGPDDLYYNYTINDNGTLVTYGSSPADYQTDVLAAHAESFIASSAGQPFFLEVTPTAPHDPRIPAPRYANLGVNVTRPPNFNEADVSDKPAWVRALQLQTDKGASQWDGHRRQEFRTVRAIDDLVHGIYDALGAIGALDNTVIVFMTDNGVLLGEHRIFGKANVYEETVRTPMLVRYPWAPDRVESRLVSNVDLAPTFAELAGIVPPSPVDGMSMVPLLENTATQWRDSVLLEFIGPSPPAFWAIRTDRWKYVELGTGERELYDLTADPYELQNRAGDPAYSDVQNDLATRLAVLRTAAPRRVLPALRVEDASVAESDPSGGAGTAHVVVSLSLATSATVTVNYATSDGSAKAGTDYASTAGTLTFPPGVRTMNVDVPLLDDSVAESEESFAIRLSGAVNATIGDDEGDVSVDDDDDVPAIDVANATVAEGDTGGTATAVSVSLSAPVTHVVTVDYATSDGSATAGSDYEAASGTVVFEPGDTSALIPLTVIADSQGERDESFFVDLSAPLGGTIGRGRGTVTVVNDDAFKALSIDDVSVVEGATGATTLATFTVSLSNADAQPVTVDYRTSDDTATAGADYEATSGSLALDVDHPTRQLSVVVDDDHLFESDERFFVDLSNGSVPIIRSRGVATIINDEALPSISVADVSSLEGNTGTKAFPFLVTLSGPSAYPVTVSYATADDTARSGADYIAASGTVTFAPLETSRPVSVSVIGDTAYEASERFRLNLSNPTGASILDGQGIGTITNDDRKG